MTKKTPNYNKTESWKMFDDISPRYDLLNRLLSFGLDVSWRKELARQVNKDPQIEILDLATGTADVLLTFIDNCPNIKSAWGIDLAEKMMEIGRNKIDKKGYRNKIWLKRGDATKIPFEDGGFDNVSISFGIRNVEDPSLVLKEMHRVLRVGGVSLVLEFSIPNNSLIRMGHIFYLRHFVPIIGWVISGHYKAYKYLNQTIETFPYGEEFCSFMKLAGFKQVQAHKLLFGVATIYKGIK